MRTDLYLTAIKNLIKMRNFANLSNDVENNDITNEEYEKELQENPKKYVIDVKNSDPIKMVPIIAKIIEDIGEPAKDLSVDDVCTIFSIDVVLFMEAYEKYITSKKSQLKIDFERISK